jgi:hypothetical protein
MRSPDDGLAKNTSFQRFDIPNDYLQLFLKHRGTHQKPFIDIYNNFLTTEILLQSRFLAG